MLTKCRIELGASDAKNFPYDAGSLFHGYLMHLIDKDSASEFHRSGLKPYSQFIEWEKDKLFWNIQSFSSEARKIVIEPLLSSEITHIPILHKDISIPINSKSLSETNYDALLQEQYFGNADRFMKIQFVTPTSFKVRGRHLHYPSIFHLFQSLMMKHDSINFSSEVFDEDVLDHLVNGTEIRHYRLRSYQFHIEKVRIPSFVGEIVLRFNMNQNLTNFARFLLKFGEYSGVGVKTALGMGALRIRDRS